MFVGGGLLVITEVTDYGFLLMALGVLLFHLGEERTVKPTELKEKL
jgi:hypothetical protein